MSLTVSPLRPNLADLPEDDCEAKERQKDNDVWMNHLLMPPPARACIRATAIVLLAWIAAVEITCGVFWLIGEHIASRSILTERSAASQEEYGCNDSEPHGSEYTL